MKKNWYVLCMVLLAGLFITACSDDDDNDIKLANVMLQFNAPTDLQTYSPTISIQELVLKNINTGESTNIIQTETRTVASGTSIAVNVPEGLYSISMEGSLSYEINGNMIHSKIKAYAENQTLTKSATSAEAINITGYVYNDSNEGGNFVIAEIFFTGTTTPEGKQYTGDKYIRIYNNSGDTLCADGLTIAESTFLTTLKYDYTPDIKDEAFTAQAIYRIPLGGNLMVAPGESLLLVDIAMNHTEVNQNSFDLTLADFEWYDVSSNPSFLDTDTDVPNLEKVYCSTATIWGPHNRGFTAFVLARLGDDENNQLSAEQYLQNFTYDYSYNMIINGTVYEMGPKNAFMIPNSWILDGVNLSVESEYVWNVLPPALDKGWTYCGTVDRDTNRYGKSVRRKVLSGKTLQDTNDSSVDFLPEQTADPYYKFHE